VYLGVDLLVADLKRRGEEEVEEGADLRG